MKTLSPEERASPMSVVLDLDARSQIFLCNAGIEHYTIDQFIAEFKTSDVLKYRNVGHVTIMKLKKALAEFGIEWAPDYPPPKRSTLEILKERLANLTIESRRIQDQIKQTKKAMTYCK